MKTMLEFKIYRSQSNRRISIDVDEIESHLPDHNSDGKASLIRTKSGDKHLVCEGYEEIRTLIFNATRGQ